MTRVAVVATGGTIASTATAGGVVASRSAADLLRSTHVTDIDVETVDLMTVGSYRMNLGHIRPHQRRGRRTARAEDRPYRRDRDHARHRHDGGDRGSAGPGP